MTKFILGTANFGMEYGVANKGKLLSKADVKTIIDWAQKNGINHFDTALAYGDVAETLGTYLNHSLNPSIDSKLDEKSCQSKDLIVKTAIEIREKLGVDQLSVLYLHNEEILQSALVSEISNGLKEVINLGIAKKIGVSVYSEASVFKCKAVLPELSVFQVPENILDRRIASSTAIQNLAESGNTFVIRSIFLQGLLLMELGEIPPHLVSAKTKIQELKSFARDNSLSVLEICLAYANSISWASGIVIGVASLNQLIEIKRTSSSLPNEWESKISILPQELVDPRKWSL